MQNYEPCCANNSAYDIETDQPRDAGAEFREETARRVFAAVGATLISLSALVVIFSAPAEAMPHQSLAHQAEYGPAHLVLL